MAGQVKNSRARRGDLIELPSRGGRRQYGHAVDDTNQNSILNNSDLERASYFTNPKYKHLYDILLKVAYEDLHFIERKWCVLFFMTNYDKMGQRLILHSKGFDTKEDMMKGIDDVYKKGMSISYILHDAQIQNFNMNVSIVLN